MAKMQVDRQEAILPSVQSRWTLKPSKIADTVVNELVSVSITEKRLEHSLAALRDEEGVWLDICNRYAAEGRNDERAQAVARELRDIRTNRMLMQERLSHSEALKGALDEVLSDNEIRPHAERRIEALGQFAQRVINDPNTSPDQKAFFTGFEEALGRRLGREEVKR